MSSSPDFEPTIADIDQSLSEIERILKQIMILAEFSASDLNVDRATLQKTLEHLQYKIDRIADNITSSMADPHEA
jgi:archaellum component FlaC